MKKSKNMLFFLSFFLAVPFFAGAVVSEDIQTKRDEMKEARDDKKAEREEAKEERVQARCENVEGRIKEKTTNYENSQTKRLNVFKSIQSRLDNLVIKAEKKGYDVTELKADLLILDQKKTTFMNEFNKHMGELKNTQDYVCGESEGAFKNQLRTSRNQLKAAREANTELRNFFKNEIKADVAALKSEVEAALRANNSDDDDDDDDDNDEAK